MSDLAEIAALALAACFAWAALAKLVWPRRWRSALAAHGSPRLVGAAAFAVPAAEAGTAALLVADARAGAALALILLTVFSFAVLRARRRAGDRLPCACFGNREERDWRAIVARNAILAAAAVLVIAAGGEDPRATATGDTLALGFALAGLALAAWTAGAARAAFRR